MISADKLASRIGTGPSLVSLFQYVYPPSSSLDDGYSYARDEFRQGPRLLMKHLSHLLLRPQVYDRRALSPRPDDGRPSCRRRAVRRLGRDERGAMWT